MEQYLVEVFESATGKLVWEHTYGTLQGAKDEMAAWDVNEYDVNFEQLTSEAA
jgi:hypothetical protein